MKRNPCRSFRRRLVTALDSKPFWRGKNTPFQKHSDRTGTHVLPLLNRTARFNWTYKFNVSSPNFQESGNPRSYWNPRRDLHVVLLSCLSYRVRGTLDDRSPSNWQPILLPAAVSPLYFVYFWGIISYIWKSNLISSANEPI